jgi:hypothetical protein
VAEQPMRYLRFIGTSNSANAYVCVSELEVYGVLPPPPWLEFSTGGVNVREGGEGRFFVRLGAAPTATVVVAVAPAAAAERRHPKRRTRTFRPSNWNVWQAVVLAAGADADATSATATFRLSAPGGRTASSRRRRWTTARAAIWPCRPAAARSRGGLAQRRTTDRRRACRQHQLRLCDLDERGARNDDAGPESRSDRVALARAELGLGPPLPALQDRIVDGRRDWSLLADASDAGRHGWDDWPVADRIVRYLRFSALSNSANAYVCVSEWEVWGMLRPLPNPELSTTNVFVREDGSGRFFLRLTNARSATSSSTWNASAATASRSATAPPGASRRRTGARGRW